MVDRNSGKKQLRRRAEKVLLQGACPPGNSGSEHIPVAMHELQVHRIELDIQNEDLRKAREELEKSRDKYVNLYDFAPVSYITLNESNIITELNLFACRLLGADKNVLKSKKFTAFVCNDNLDNFYLCRKKALGLKTPVTCEIRMEDMQHRVFPARVDLLALPDEPGSFRLTISDITEQNNAERVKDEFLGMISHELRTPLTVLIGSVNVARSPALTKREITELLRHAEYSARSLAHLLDNLLELSRSRADRLLLDNKPLDITTTIEHVVEKIKAAGYANTFSLVFPTGLPRIEADRVRLELILNNLIDNAIKYSPAKSEIKIIVCRELNDVSVGVCDRGKGITLENQAKLFTPFERLAETSTTRPGLGLGLIVCKHLVEANGGKIWVESGPDKGTIFWFTVPVALSPVP